MYGNPNVAQYNACQYMTVDGSSDSVTLSGKAKAITLYSTTACWVKLGRGSQTAVKPGAEKTTGGSFFVPASTFISAVGVSGTEETPTVVAAIQDSAGGTLYVYEHQEF